MSDALATGVVVVDVDGDRRRAVRAALVAHPDLRVVAEAGDAGGAVMAAAQTVPDVVVLHADLGPDLVRAARRIHHDLPGTALVGVGPVEPSAAVVAGMVAVVDPDDPELAARVHGAARGEAHLAPAVAALLAGDLDPGDLSATEVEVLGQLGRGATVDELAARYDVDPHLVRVHARAVLDRVRAAAEH